MSQIEVLPLLSQDRAWVRQFITEHWGADFVVARGLVHYPHELSGFVAIQDEGGIGLITYHITDAGCEIVTLNSTRPAIGMGLPYLKLSTPSRAKPIVGACGWSRPTIT